MIYRNIEIFNIAQIIELEDSAFTWRRVPKAAEDTLELMGKTVDMGWDPNVTYINDMDILGDVSWFAADGLHPSCYGHQKIAHEVYERIKNCKF